MKSLEHYAVLPASDRGRSTPRAETLRLPPNDVDVWSIALDDQPADAVASMATLLSSDETQRAKQFYFDRDRRRYVVGRAVLRLTLGRYLDRPAEKLVFRYGASGKPALATGQGEVPPIHFNVAHSEGLALYAFTRVGEIGIDVEFMRDLPDWEQVAETAFSPHELAQLRACPAEQRRDEFFRAWTRQEAVLKAHGTGLGEMKALERESAFCVHPLHPAPGYAAALAAGVAAKRPAGVLGWKGDAHLGSAMTKSRFAGVKLQGGTGDNFL